MAARMRILWFTNIELPAVRRKLSLSVPSGGGWMESLRQALRACESVDLGVAAMGTVPYESFCDEGVCYFHVGMPQSGGGPRGVVDRWRHRLDYRQALARATAIVDTFKPDLIHVHGSEGPFGLLAENTDVPVVVSLQGLLVVYSRFYFAGLPLQEAFRAAASMEFLKGRGMLHASWNMRVAAQRELKILGACRYFAGRTEWDKSVLLLVNAGARYYQVEEVLRPEFYRGEWRGAANDCFVLYTTGGSAPYKGLLYLLETVALVRPSLGKEVQLRISGQIGGTNMWAILQRALRRLGLEDITVWLGPLPAADIALELEKASIYVHPSHIDNSPNSLAEAMLVGVPCVATSAGGIPSMISSGTDGLICGPNDVYGLAGRIAAIAADSDLAAHLGAGAHARARRRHDPRTVAEATVDMYTDVIARDSQRPL